MTTEHLTKVMPTPPETLAATAGTPTTEASTSDPSASDRRASWMAKFSGPLLIRRAGEPEALVLTLICALDMYTTLWWVVTGRATESNEGLAWTFQHHPVLFVLVKCLSCLPALLLAPILARRHPIFTTWLLRGIIAFYITYYCINIR